MFKSFWVRNIFYGLGTLLIILFGAFFLFGGKSVAPTESTNGTSPVPNTESASTKTKAFAIQEISLHNKATDCWTIVNGKVYDITSYVPRHPGGDEILRACGTDGTTLFTTRTTSDGQKIGSGTPHDSSAQAQLASMQIGVLAQ